MTGPTRNNPCQHVMAIDTAGTHHPGIPHNCRLEQHDTETDHQCACGIAWVHGLAVGVYTMGDPVAPVYFWDKEHHLTQRKPTM